MMAADFLRRLWCVFACCISSNSFLFLAVLLPDFGLLEIRFPIKNRFDSHLSIDENFFNGMRGAN